MLPDKITAVTISFLFLIYYSSLSIL